METPEVAEFRRCILDASWDSAEAALVRLGVTEGEGLWVRTSSTSCVQYRSLPPSFHLEEPGVHAIGYGPARCGVQ